MRGGAGAGSERPGPRLRLLLRQVDVIDEIHRIELQVLDPLGDADESIGWYRIANGPSCAISSLSFLYAAALSGPFTRPLASSASLESGSL